MNKRKATYSLDVDLIKLIPAVMEVKNYTYTKSDFLTDCIISEALKYKGNYKIDILLKKLLTR